MVSGWTNPEEIAFVDEQHLDTRYLHKDFVNISDNMLKGILMASNFQAKIKINLPRD